MTFVLLLVFSPGFISSAFHSFNPSVSFIVFVSFSILAFVLVLLRCDFALRSFKYCLKNRIVATIKNKLFDPTIKIDVNICTKIDTLPGFSLPRKNNKPPQKVKKQTVNATNSKSCNRLELGLFTSKGFPDKCRMMEMNTTAKAMKAEKNKKMLRCQ